MVSGKIGRGQVLGRGTKGDKSTHPTPEILWAGHLTRLSRSMAPVESIGGCGGDDLVTESSKNATEVRTGFCCTCTRLIGSLFVDAQKHNHSLANWLANVNCIATNDSSS